MIQFLAALPEGGTSLEEESIDEDLPPLPDQLL
jgi:hypothetical protein